MTPSTPLPEQGGDAPTGLDEAVRMFAGYVRGENGFDELDFKEWLIEWREQEIAKARIEELDHLYDHYSPYRPILDNDTQRSVRRYASGRIAELSQTLKEYKE